MKTIEGLTELENQVLNIICWELLTWRYDEPGYSCIDGSDITKRLAWNPKKTSGVISSLNKKGFIVSEEDNINDRMQTTIYVNWEKIPSDFGLTV